MAPTYKQDLPPTGGYAPIDWSKRVVKKISGWKVFLGFTVFTLAAWEVYWWQRRRHRWRNVEMNDARIAVTPFIVAEHQRCMLKHLVKNRDEEAELMKNVPNWKVGTLYGEPVFHNLRDRFNWPSLEEFYAHNKWADMYDTKTDPWDRS